MKEIAFNGEQMCYFARQCLTRMVKVVNDEQGRGKGCSIDTSLQSLHSALIDFINENEKNI